MLGGRVGRRRQRSLRVKNLGTAPDRSGSRESKEERLLQSAKVQASLATRSPLHLEVFLTSVASGAALFYGKRLLHLQQSPSPHGQRGLLGTKASLPQLHPFCFIPFVSHKGEGVAWRHRLSFKGKAVHSDGSHTSLACNSLEILLNCKPKPRGLVQKCEMGPTGLYF